MIDPEDNNGCDADGEEGVCAAVIAGVDAPPVFEFAEHVLDLVGLAVGCAVVRNLRSAVGL